MDEINAERVVDSDFIVAVLSALRIRGIKSIGITDPLFDRACEATFELLAERGLNLRFRIRTDVIHGTSRIVRDIMIPFVLMVGHAHTRVPGDGMLYIDIEYDYAKELLSRTPGGYDVWIDAIDVFIGVYENQGPA